MTARQEFPEIPQLNALARAAATLGYEIVDIAGFLDMVEAQALEQRTALSALESGASDIEAANAAVQTSAFDLGESVSRTAEDVEQSATLMRALGARSQDVAEWVQDLSDRSGTVSDTLKAAKDNNAQIAAISMQVNTLAINAKIEAARAGDAGRGFAVVAEAINELSRKTKDAAAQISTNIETLTDWIATLNVEASNVSQTATELIDHSSRTDGALTRMERSIADTQEQAQRIETQAGKVRTAIEQFSPDMRGIGASIATTTSGIHEAHGRIQRLIDTSETIVQSSAGLGGMTDDAPYIAYARDRAAAIIAAFEALLESGRLTRNALFDRAYQQIPNTNPAQVRTAYVDLFDQILPAIQEPALEFDPKVVFCAAVDVNGYLPTHNLKFSQPQSHDVVWNTGHCRNRRIFDDRVGLKAGRNTAPFLLQVYRRDMGGGAFKMMKDLSVPITVNGEHWGGLRLAYTF
ncbi:methyl-accepting chemotaxis protein [uncultured Tateyamaria sp.]|uniref:methyl-accepting chemotaxis protein n=1 Tax=uncultured Tateyamaria sp. TaxID=455651 RepID=UPI0026124CB4|nr:methyl-accepting chemotaxis protein [uncultured Tateyamaria sp.]